MTTYQTPGVYYQRTDAGAPAIGPLRTDVAGFVGLARRGPVDTAVTVRSWRQFHATFGDLGGVGYLAYTVRAFFENGGRECRVVRVASPAASAAGADLLDSAGNAAWRVEASSEGVWGNDLTVKLRATHRAQTTRRDGHDNSPTRTAVRSVVGFARGSLVRVTQDGVSALRVVSDVDPRAGLLFWVNPDDDRRLIYDAPLAGFSDSRPLVIQSVEYDLLVYEAGRLSRVYDGLTPVREHASYGPAAVAAAAGSASASAVPPSIVLRELRDVNDPTLTELAIPARPVPFTGGAEGLSDLSVYDFIGEEIDPLDGDVLARSKRRGLRVLADVEAVAILAVPDIQVRPAPPPQRAPLPPCVPDPCLPGGPAVASPAPPVPAELPPLFSQQDILQVQAAMIDQCERLGDRFALLDPPAAPPGRAQAATAAVRAWRRQFDSSYAALYFPWVRVVDPAALTTTGAPLTLAVPPCGHVAGQFARTDLRQGVHHAPANAPLAWASDLTITVADELHGVLNSSGINVLRALPGRGLRIFGARTVGSDPDWRFVNVRRLMMMIEKACRLSLQWAVFEPNDEQTRSKINLALVGFLVGLWQTGALAGDEPAAAFRVRCDATNNPPATRDSGHLLAEVSVAPSVPFEFIVVRIRRVDNEFRITDSSAL